MVDLHFKFTFSSGMHFESVAIIKLVDDDTAGRFGSFGDDPLSAHASNGFVGALETALLVRVQAAALA